MATATITRAASREVRNMLEARDLTQEWLSDASGIPMRTLSRRLHLLNPSPMTLEDLAAIADALDVPIVRLLMSVRTRERVAA